MSKDSQFLIKDTVLFQLFLCSASSYCHPEEFCTRPNVTHYHKLQNNHVPKKTDWCGCSNDPLFEIRKSHIRSNEPYIFHPSHSELGHSNGPVHKIQKYDVLKRPNIYSKPDDTINFPSEELPVFPAHSCRSINSDLLLNSCSSDFLDNIDILIEAMDKSDKSFCENRNDKCQHNVDRNKHTKVCCQLFCCNNLSGGNIFLCKNKPNFNHGCEYGAVRESQSCCEHEERNFVPNIQLSECEHSSDDEQEQLCDHYSDCCEDISFIKEPTIINSEEVATKEERDYSKDCQVQTQVVPGTEDRVEVIAEVNTNTEDSTLFKQSDSAEFREFMKTVPLTGERDIDEEIYNFYRNKFCA